MSNMKVKLFLVAALYVALLSSLQCQSCDICIKDMSFSEENAISLRNQTPSNDGCTRDIKFDVKKCITNLAAEVSMTMENGQEKTMEYKSNDGQKDLLEKMAADGTPTSSSTENCSIEEASYSLDELSAQALKSLGSEKAKAMDIAVMGNNHEKMVSIHVDIEYRGCK